MTQPNASITGGARVRVGAAGSIGGFVHQSNRQVMGLVDRTALRPCTAWSPITASKSVFIWVSNHRSMGLFLVLKMIECQTDLRAIQRHKLDAHRTRTCCL